MKRSNNSWGGLKSKVSYYEINKLRSLRPVDGFGVCSLIRIKDVQRCLNLSYERVHGLIQHGYFPHVRIGKCIRIQPELFLSWVDAGRPVPKRVGVLSVRVANVISNISGWVYEETPDFVRSLILSGRLSLKCRNFGKASMREACEFAGLSYPADVPNEGKGK